MLLKVLDKIAPDMIGTNIRTICLPFYIGSVVEKKKLYCSHFRTIADRYDRQIADWSPEI